MRISVRVRLVVAAAVLLSLAGASSASAAAPWWTTQAVFLPSVLVPGHQAQLVLSAADLGDVAVSGAQTVTITDVLPPGVKATAITKTTSGIFNVRGEISCPTSFPSNVVTCTWSGGGLGQLQPYEELKVFVTVEAEEGIALGQKQNEARVSGGEGYVCRKVASGTGAFLSPDCVFFEAGAGSYEGEGTGRTVPAVSERQPVTVGSGPTPFGIHDYRLAPEGEAGAPATQAGSHPVQLTTTIAFNAGPEANTPPALAKDLSFHWPAGLTGNPIPFPQCSDANWSHIGQNGLSNLCPTDTAIGVAQVDDELKNGEGLEAEAVPVFNLTPQPGEPARFGFFVNQVPVVVDASVRTGGNYGIDVHVSNITQLAGYVYSRVTVWGVPGDPVHDSVRGWSCVQGGLTRFFSSGALPPCAALGQSSPPPFLTLPTSCTGPLQTTAEADSWADPKFGPPVSPTEGYGMPAMDGCDELPFSAQISVQPDVPDASTATGLTVKVHVPQEASLNPNGIAGADVKDTTVTLPEGVTTNPAGAGGLEACSEHEIGFTGIEPGTGTDLFTSGLPAPKEAPAEPFCPNASKIGTVKITTPLLAHPLEGAVYLAAQNDNPFGSLVAAYIVAEDPVSGVLVKLPGEVTLDPNSGQIVSTFKNTPQVPFEDLEVHFFGGERAPFATPALCGAYNTKAVFTPWSGNEPITSNASFNITTGPNGTPCPNPLDDQSLSTLPFAPTLDSYTTNINAAAFSPLVTTIGRADGNQDIQRVTLHYPPGISGLIAGVKLCAEAQANAGTCGPESLIGHTTVSVGVGNDPYTVTGGEVFLTEKYEGAPFGLSIVNPAVAGPFNLGKVVVRAKIEVDPHTAALTITTGEIPHILKGIPLQIKHINVTIDRPGFTFNPTNCRSQTITGTIGSVQGASSTVSIPFQVTNCAILKFTPKLTVSTSAKSSKARGSSLTTKLSEPGGSQGTQANIARVKVDLPIQLPSQLKTLQKACLAAVFEANPASCPPESIVGHARVVTPLLPVPLTGPAYFVSHGGEAFPSLTMVLQGYGVTVELVGSTFIKHGITSSTFKTVPDVPFNTFELTLPQGKYAALGANLPARAKGSFCGQNLKMPTELVAQNGMVIHQDTQVAVKGCTTRAQQLETALKACRKKAKGKRAVCALQARRKYGPIKKKA
jgi:hypothetical protein